MNYRLNKTFSINTGFSLTASHVADAINLTNAILYDLPSTLYKCLDFKTISAMVGAIYCDALASKANCLVNPIEKGHPDLVPLKAKKASEAQLRNYGVGLEVKCTIGNVETGANLRAGVKRIDKLSGVTWQAHHREVKELMGIIWDFVQPKDSFSFPAITGVFCAKNLVIDDWGKISGTTGRNTKVSGMKSSGKRKMGDGWVASINDPSYVSAFDRFLGVKWQ